MKLDTTSLISLLPPGPSVRRLELFLSMEAVVRHVVQKGAKLVFVELREAPLISVRYKVPLLAVRAAIERLIREANAHPPEVA